MAKDTPNPDDIVQMEKLLNKMEFELQNRYAQMGKALLELAEKEQSSVNDLVDQMIDMRKCLAKAKGEQQCPECMTLNTPHSKYCSFCGLELPAAAADEEGE